MCIILKFILYFASKKIILIQIPNVVACVGLVVLGRVMTVVVDRTVEVVGGTGLTVVTGGTGPGGTGFPGGTGPGGTGFPGGTGPGGIGCPGGADPGGTGCPGGTAIGPATMIKNIVLFKLQ